MHGNPLLWRIEPKDITKSIVAHVYNSSVPIYAVVSHSFLLTFGFWANWRLARAPYNLDELGAYQAVALSTRDRLLR
jgi:hypothetical protein